MVREDRIVDRDRAAVLFSRRQLWRDELPGWRRQRAPDDRKVQVVLMACANY
jgi:hypothetical protein